MLRRLFWLTARCYGFLMLRNPHFITRNTVMSLDVTPCMLVDDYHL